MDNLKVYPSILDQLRDIIFLNKLLGNVQDFHAHILKFIDWGLEVKQIESKQTKRALQRDSTLLIMSLRRSREIVGVPIFTG